MGFILGFVCRMYRPSSETIMMLSFPGDLLMRMLKMLILPLITSSLITGLFAMNFVDGTSHQSVSSSLGLAVLDPKASGKLGLYALTYYFCTTILAAVLGIILVQTIRPGERGNQAQVRSSVVTADDPKADQMTTLDAIFDLFR
jgi:solute carrier family 1 (glial high affinity glutamate transporter), member 2